MLQTVGEGVRTRSDDSGVHRGPEERAS